MAAPPASQHLVWAPCPTCWGQGRILEVAPAGNGEGAVSRWGTCSGCLGVGAAPSTGVALPPLVGRSAAIEAARAHARQPGL
jgi:hypothetical protein